MTLAPPGAVNESDENWELVDELADADGSASSDTASSNLFAWDDVGSERSWIDIGVQSATVSRQSSLGSFILHDMPPENYAGHSRQSSLSSFVMADYDQNLNAGHSRRSSSSSFVMADYDQNLNAGHSRQSSLNSLIDVHIDE